MPSTVLRSGFHNFVLPVSPAKFTLRQKFGNHTLGWLDFEVEHKVDYLMPPEQTPVAVQWGTSPLGTQTFYGYVNHYETVVVNGRALTRLWIRGTSKVLNSAHPSNWHGMSRSSIAREIAKRHKFRSIIHSHSHVLDTWAGGNRTDFQMLRDLAEEIGYRSWVDGSTLYFLDPKRVLLSPQSFESPVIRDDQVRNDEVVGGTGAPRDEDSAVRSVMYGLDYRTNEFFEATGGDPKFAAKMVGANITNYSDAEAMTEAADASNSVFYTAKITASGNAAVRPGALVYVEESQYTRDRGGYWVATEATHEVSETDFQTKFEAVRSANRQPYRSTTTVRGAQEISGATVRDGATWEALVQEHVYV